MKRFLGMDTKIYRFFAMAWNLIVLNLLTLIACIPVITAGAAITAMHYVLLKLVRGEESYVGRMFWGAFKDNLKKGTLLGLAFIALFVSYRVDWMFTVNNPEILGRPVQYAIMILAILTFMLMQFVFPMLSHFENTILMTVLNSLILCISNVPRLLVMTLVWVIPYEIFIHSFALLPLIVMLGITLPGFICAKMYHPIFKKLEPEEEEEDFDQVLAALDYAENITDIKDVL